MLLESFLERSAARVPDRVALVCGERRVTYADLERRANALANALIAEGVARGDRVLVQLGSREEAAIAIFGALKAGAVFSVVHPTTKPGQVRHLLRDCEARALVCGADQPLDATTAGATALRLVITVGDVAKPLDALGLRVLRFSDLVTGSFTAPKKRCIDIDLAALVYTSGSTGLPKGVMLTHLNMVAAATSITTYLENTEDDVVFSCLPLSFDYGLYQLLMVCRMGARLVLEPSFAYPHAMLQRIVREGVTGLPIVPTMSAILLQRDLSAYDLSKLRYVTNTAAALPVDHIARLRRALPGVRIYSMYGLTECKRVAYLPPEEIDRRPGSVGKAMPNVEAYVVDESGARLGPGEIGELVVRGSNVMKGYWGMPAETDAVLRPGPLPGERVLHTGDLFRTDDDGYLTFVGRRDEMIKSRGEKVSPREVETAIHALAGVAQVTVIGVPDPVLGEAIAAFVVAREGAEVTAAGVRAHCAKSLEEFKVPGRVTLLDALPLRPSGKVDRRALIERSEACDPRAGVRDARAPGGG
ncbi:MAG: AMP-binding protein [Deltaproteobacteria bacterium]|nr:AMP-binding protein [Deltaproteobacteria bacterium]